MDAAEAREHLTMVERIIAASSRKLEAGGEFFIAWGLAGATMDTILTAVVNRKLPPQAQLLNAAILLCAIVFTVLRARHFRQCGERMSLLQREYLNVLWLAIAVSFLSQLVAFNIFPTMAQMAMWNVVEAFVLFYIGMHGNRRAQIGGIILMLSIAVANFVPAYTGYILAAGVLFGYGGFGVADLLARE